MLGFGDAWWIVLVAAVVVWIASAIAWMVLPHHRRDFKQLPDEEAARQALANAGPGEYMVPYCASMNDAKSESFREKQEQGPNGYVMIRAKGPVNMGKALGLWFGYTVLVSFIVAYVSRQALPAGTGFKEVMQFSGAVAIAIYALQPIPISIWKPQPWSTAFTSIVDGVAYGVLTGAVFAWLWPDSAPPVVG